MIAQEAWWRLGVDQLVFVPVGAPGGPSGAPASRGPAGGDGRIGDRRASRLALLTDRGETGPGPAPRPRLWPKIAGREAGCCVFGPSWVPIGWRALPGGTNRIGFCRWARLAVVSKDRVDLVGAATATAAGGAPGRVDPIDGTGSGRVGDDDPRAAGGGGPGGVDLVLQWVAPFWPAVRIRGLK